MKEDQEKVINCVGTVIYRINPTTGEREFYLQKRFVPERFRNNGRSGLRTDHDTFEIPCGAIEEGEKQRVAAMREAREETGIEGLQISSKAKVRYGKAKGMTTRGKEGDEVKVILGGVVEQTVGNRHWILKAVFLARVPFDVKVTINKKEASDYGWFAEKDLKDMLTNNPTIIFNLVVPALKQVLGLMN